LKSKKIRRLGFLFPELGENKASKADFLAVKRRLLFEN
jgi:hypothetical protein